MRGRINNNWWYRNSKNNLPSKDRWFYRRRWEIFILSFLLMILLRPVRISSNCLKKVIMMELSFTESSKGSWFRQDVLREMVQEGSQFGVIISQINCVQKNTDSKSHTFWLWLIEDLTPMEASSSSLSSHVPGWTPNTQFSAESRKESQQWSK